MASFNACPLRSIHSSEIQSNMIGGTETQKINVEIRTQNRTRVLCLHGFRTSAEILKKQVGRWPETVLGKLDLVFIDGPFLAGGKSDVEGIFDPPYYEWYQSSQGAFLSAALPGMQLEGVALTKVPMIKFLIIISGAKFGGYKYGSPKLAANAFSSRIKCPSLHIIGEKDFLKEQGIALLKSFEDPIVIHHPFGHTVPRLDDKGLDTMMNFIEKIEKMHLQEE